ncbi:MAG: efflux RND transporter periplasmic adaptor subunit [Rubrivivax sp.]
MTSRRRKIVVATAVLLLLAAAVTWWIQRPATPPPPKYRTAAVDRGPITQVVMATGTLQPVVTVTVGTQVSGTVLERLADFNDPVKRGQVLLRLDPSNLQARLRQAQAQRAAAQAALTLAEATLERNQKLVGQGFISALALDQSRREQAAASANVALAQAQVDAARTDVDNSVIRSPIDGIVLRRNIDVGQTVAASFQTPELYLIAKDLKQMEIHTSVSEADVGQITKGLPARFTVDAWPDTEFAGVVEQFRLNAANNNGIVTYDVIVSVDNSDGRLKPGMTAQVRVVLQSKTGVLRLPTAALRFQPDDDERKAIAAAAKSEASAPATTAASSASASSAGAASPFSDDGVLSATRGGQRIYRVWTVGAGQLPVPHEVTVGISNTRYTELQQLLSGSLKAGDALITRRIAADSAGSRP